MSLDLARPHKKVELTLDISANRQSVINGGEEFFTMDSGGTAVGIFNFRIEDEDGEFNPIDLTDVKKILIGFYFTGAETRMVLEPEILDVESGRVALVLPNQFEYSGPVLGYTYILWEDRELDGGEFRLTFTESWLDKELPEMDDFYVQRFEDLAAEIRQRVETIKAEMDSELNVVKDDITTAQTDINSIQKQIDDNDIVTRDEAKETLAEYDRKLFESASLLHQIDKDETIENTREGKLTNRSLTGRTLVNLWSDRREDFTAINNLITLSEGTATLVTPETNTGTFFNFFQSAARLKPNTRYTIVVDAVFSANVKLTLNEGDSQSFCAFTSPSSGLQSSGRHVVILTTKSTLTEASIIRMYFQRLSAGAINASAKISIYEGDLTKLALNHTQPLTLASVGDGVDMMQVKTVGTNLFKGDETIRVVRSNDVPIEPAGGWKVGVHYYVRITGSNATTTATNGVIISTIWKDGTATTHRAFRGAIGHNGDSSRYFTLTGESRSTFLGIHSSNAAGAFVDISNIQISQVPVGNDLLPFTPHQSTTSTYEYQTDDGLWLPIPNLKGIMSGGDLLIGDEITDNEYIQRVVELDLEKSTVSSFNLQLERHARVILGVGIDIGGNTAHTSGTSNRIPRYTNAQWVRDELDWYITPNTNEIVVKLPHSRGSTGEELLQYLIDNDYQFLVPLATPKRYPIRTQSLSSFNPVTNIVMQTGAVQPSFNFKIVQSLSERMTVAEGSIRRQSDKISDVNTDLDNLTNKIDALKPTTAPLPLATTPQIGASGQYADAKHVHQMPTASQVGALPSTGGTVTGRLTLAQDYNVHRGAGSSGTAGWVRIARLRVTSANLNAPIEFAVTRRGDNRINYVTVRFNNPSAANLASITYRGVNNFEAHMSRVTDTSIEWDLIIRKAVANDVIEIVSLKRGNGHVPTITWMDEIVTILPAGITRATPEVINADTAGQLNTTKPFAITGAVEGAATSDLADGVTVNTQNRLVSVSDWDNIDPATLGLRNGDTVNIVGPNTSLNQPQGTTGSTWIGVLRRIHSARYILSAEQSLTRQAIRVWESNTWGAWQDANETALRLRTPRQINGTSFDGSANITTAHWGTNRNITIGDMTKSFNGAGDIAWTLADIGAVGASKLVNLGIGESAGRFRVDNLLIQTGSVLIPGGSGSHTSLDITFSEPYVATPNIQVSCSTNVIGTLVLGVAANNQTRLGFQPTVLRTNATGTWVNWTAIGVAE